MDKTNNKSGIKLAFGFVLGIIAVVVLVIALLLFVIFAFVASDDGEDAELDYDFEFGSAGLSSHVLAYKPLIEKVAKREGLSDLVPLFLAMMQQESGGNPNSLDPMQSSESKCGYIGCIKDPEESIEQFIKYFKGLMEKVGDDLDLAIVSYNMGPAFIPWWKERQGDKKYRLNKEINGKKTSTEVIAFSQHWYNKNPSLYSCLRAEGAPLKACHGDIMYLWSVKQYMSPVDNIIKIDGKVSDVRKGVATVGQQWVGNSTYVFGGGRNQAEINKGQFDCSSFVHWAYAQNGIDLGNVGNVNTNTLKVMGKKIDIKDVKVGDLIFWDTYKVDGHVGIYVGNGKWIGANTSTGVAIVDFDNQYWKSVFRGHVRRIIND